METNMRKLAGGLCLIAALSISLLATPLGANELKRTVIAPKYDVSKEITLEGTVENLVKNPAPGMILGAHLIVSTAQGMVDAHIGNYVISGPHAASFASGQAVKLVGVMVEVNHQSVLIVRTIETEDHTIVVRNDHGFLVFPGSKLSLRDVSSTGGVR
jgi:hypothetical protein